MKRKKPRKWKRLVDTKYFDPNADLKKPVVIDAFERWLKEFRHGCIYAPAVLKKYRAFKRKRQRRKKK